MKLIVIMAILCLSTIACNTLKDLKPQDYIYIVHEGKPCFWNTARDLETKDPKRFFCKEWKEVEGRLVVDPVKFKEILVQGVDLLIQEKASK